MRKSRTWFLFILVSLLLIAVGSPHAIAAGEQCEALFSPVEAREIHTNADAYILKTEIFRTELLHHAEGQMAGWRVERNLATSSVLHDVEAMLLNAQKLIDRKIEDSPTLRGLNWSRETESRVLPPPIGKEVFDLIKALHKNGPNRHGSEVQLLRDTLARDPFVQWAMKQRSAEVQFDPIDHVLKSERMGFPPELVVLRLYRDFNEARVAPHLKRKMSDRLRASVYEQESFLMREQTQVITRLLESYKKEFVWENEIIQFLADRSHVLGTDQAWDLIAGERAGQAALELRMARQVRLYGHLLPKDSFDRMNVYFEAIRQKRPRPFSVSLRVLQSYGNFKRQGVSETENVNRHRSELDEVRVAFGLPAEFPLARLYDYALMINDESSTLAYGLLLARLFSPKVDGVQMDALQIEYGGKILAIARGLLHERAPDNFRDQVYKRHGHKYFYD